MSTKSSIGIRRNRRGLLVDCVFRQMSWLQTVWLAALMTMKIGLERPAECFKKAWLDTLRTMKDGLERPEQCFRKVF
ncbi:hypothetical protein NPIL_603681 [Nephila pilipes]|uniref:Uncharacterized protein n=1 Tax=Nephila pilipes TaxID=299642 RepID=A0A8X6P265_NEPPI|nr:hypothetical protein NPIL_603681 [Nephila pilipes]